MSALPTPPAWKDIGKASNDLLSKDFPIHGTFLEVKTRTPSAVTFRVVGDRNSKGAIKGDLEAKYADPQNGVTFTQAWTTQNVLKSNLELENNLAKGLKFDINTTLNPEKHTQSVSLTTYYKQPGLNTRALIDLFNGPSFTADTVIGRNGFLLGAEAQYNVSKGAVTRYATALAYTAPEYAVALHGLNNLTTFAASYFHRVNPDVEAGAKAIYDTKPAPSGGHGHVTLEVGTKVYLDKAAFVKAKIASSGVLGLSYTQALRPGVKATFCLALDTIKLNDHAPTGPTHSVGASLVFEN